MKVENRIREFNIQAKLRKLLHGAFILHSLLHKVPTLACSIKKMFHNINSFSIFVTNWIVHTGRGWENSEWIKLVWGIKEKFFFLSFFLITIVKHIQLVLRLQFILYYAMCSWQLNMFFRVDGKAFEGWLYSYSLEIVPRILETLK